MSKWLIIQSDGEHKGQDGWTPNWYLRECYAIKHALVNNNQECDIWGLRHSGFENVPSFSNYDFILCIENYENSWLPILSDIKGPCKIQWIIDLHCQESMFYKNISHGCDIILHSTKSLIDGYQKEFPSKKHIWFPNGVDDRFFVEQSISKDRDVVFVGSKNPSRKDFIEMLEKDVGLAYFFATGEDMIKTIASAKIHFNKNIDVDMNYRIFETIGIGTCLITNYDETLTEMGFRDGYNVLLYKNYEEAANIITSCLSDCSWEHIGKNGQSLSKSHTYTKRIESLLQSL